MVGPHESSKGEQEYEDEDNELERSKILPDEIE